MWRDLNDDGIAQTGEPGIDGVLVQLLNGSGTVVAETVTAGGGKYSFADLLPATTRCASLPSQTPRARGDLRNCSRRPSTASRRSDNTVVNREQRPDNDNNGRYNGASAGTLASSTLGGASEPTNEQLRADDSTDDDNDSFADTASNYSVDFGFWAQMRLGNTVWIDQSDNNPATYVATDNNGVLDAGEAVLPNVGVAVWRDGGNGTFDAGTAREPTTPSLAPTSPTPRATGSSTASGRAPTSLPSRTFPQATRRTYPRSASPRQTPTPTTSTTVRPASMARATLTPAFSGPVVLTVGRRADARGRHRADHRPNGDANAEAEANRTSGLTVRDSDSNLTVDLSFVAPPTYRIGNLVWLDTNRNGVADSGEPGSLACSFSWRTPPAPSSTRRSPTVRACTSSRRTPLAPRWPRATTASSFPPRRPRR